eukprot:TRINITY_DN3140_c0_g1_i6.p1 TRINITY_DN3140_c0_g1~~TRINITY_DN3140_c0_g1_i6.p1  ORF type:complete len:324 (-),score=81.73 TRINITY_DN3140_c0_g1_i6:224-1195(-)
MCIRDRLSAGAVCTPWLLMLSGIGPAAHLESNNVPVVKDAPGVGQNLQDHVMSAVLKFPVRKERMGEAVFSEQSTMGTIKNLYNHAMHGRNSLFSSCFVSGLGFWRTGLLPESEGNDVGIHLVPFCGPADPEASKRNFGIDEKDTPLMGPDGIPEAMGFAVSLLKPKSRGTIELTSSDPLQYPKIDPAYLSDPQDLEALVSCWKKTREIVSCPPLCNRLDPASECKDETIEHPLDSDEYIAELIRRTLITIYHPVGTAKMGPESDAMAVVSPQLKVHGIKGLRVADASIMPTIVSGNTNAPSIMIGEKCAAMIIADCQLGSRK